MDTTKQAQSILAKDIDGHHLVSIETTEVIATCDSRHNDKGDLMGYEATGECVCGETVAGRCITAKSAREWLATEFHYHVRSATNRHPFEAFAQIEVTP